MARITVEDCLDHVENRFHLALLAAKRARQLMRGSVDPTVAWENDKATVVALREIANGHVDFSDSHTHNTADEHDHIPTAGENPLNSNTLLSKPGIETDIKKNPSNQSSVLPDNSEANIFPDNTNTSSDINDFNKQSSSGNDSDNK